MRLFVISSIIINNFGKNPKKGGSPPKLKKRIIRRNFDIGDRSEKVIGWLFILYNESITKVIILVTVNI
jgi:hypothetical protein